MGNLAKLTDRHFRRDRLGQRIYMPPFRLGMPRVLATDADETRLWRSVRNFYRYVVYIVFPLAAIGWASVKVLSASGAAEEWWMPALFAALGMICVPAGVALWRRASSHALAARPLDLVESNVDEEAPSLIGLLGLVGLTLMLASAAVLVGWGVINAFFEL